MQERAAEGHQRRSQTEKDLGFVGQESMFNEYVRVTRTEGVDDKDSTDMVVALLDEAGVGLPKAKGKPQEMQLSEKLKARVWEHREKTHEIRRITKELVGRVGRCDTLAWSGIFRNRRHSAPSVVPELYSGRHSY